MHLPEELYENFGAKLSFPLVSEARSSASRRIRTESDPFVSTGMQLLFCAWNLALRGTMTQSTTPLDSLLATIVLAALAIGLPFLLVLAIRFLWDRNLNLCRSKELDKLTWQLHRIASALEHQMNLSFPAVQPGTEEPRDLVYLQQLAARPAATTPSAAAPSSAIPVAGAARPATRQAPPQPVAQQAVAQQTVTEQAMTPPAPASQEPVPGLELREPSVEAPRAGVNSMFGL
jgi:hypothetical protein